MHLRHGRSGTATECLAIQQGSGGSQHAARYPAVGGFRRPQGRLRRHRPDRTDPPVRAPLAVPRRDPAVVRSLRRVARSRDHRQRRCRRRSSLGSGSIHARPRRDLRLQAEPSYGRPRGGPRHPATLRIRADRQPTRRRRRAPGGDCGGPSRTWPLERGPPRGQSRRGAEALVGYRQRRPPDRSVCSLRGPDATHPAECSSAPHGFRGWKRAQLRGKRRGRPAVHRCRVGGAHGGRTSPGSNQTSRWSYRRAVQRAVPATAAGPRRRSHRR